LNGKSTVGAGRVHEFVLISGEIVVNSSDNIKMDKGK